MCQKMVLRFFNLFFFVLIVVAHHWAFTSEIEFSAQVDQSQITLDDMVTLKFTIQAAQQISGLLSPEFQAPDFDIINEYSNTSFQSLFENGQVTLRNTQQLVKVLKPQKTGNLQITGILFRADNKVYTAPSISVRVDASGTTPGAGAGTPPPRNYGGAGMGLRGSGKAPSSSGFFVRAEIDKQKVYKGEQLIVSYYLYARAKIFNLEARKYPTLSGFLREDLEMPILDPRLNDEPYVLDGVSYRRALLVRYAAYPLKDGKLRIDPMAIRASYYKNQAMDFDGEDLFMGFFRQLTPLVGTSESEPIFIEVLPLPQTGKPASFTGGVGDFHIVAAVDKNEVKVNEALTLKIKIEGRGNVSAIGEPRGNWPAHLELYDAKGRAKNSKNGMGEKIFEFLLIPRTAGKLILPALEFSFFDPVRKSYVTKMTEPFDIQVHEAAGGDARGSVQSPKSLDQEEQDRSVRTPNPSGALDLDPLKNLNKSELFNLSFIWNAWKKPQVFWVFLITVTFLGIFIGRGEIRKYLKKLRQNRNHRVQNKAKNWNQLRQAAVRAKVKSSWDEVCSHYENLSGAVYDAIDRVVPGLGSRSIPRSELQKILVFENGVEQPLWDRCNHLLEFAETVRYAISTGVVTEQEARERLENWVHEGEAVSRLLEKKKNSQRVGKV